LISQSRGLGDVYKRQNQEKLEESMLLTLPTFTVAVL
jgi:hypothetical protein